MCRALQHRVEAGWQRFDEQLDQNSNRTTVGCQAGIGWCAASWSVRNRRGFWTSRCRGPITAASAVPAKPCPQTRWDSDLVSPPVPSCCSRLPIPACVSLVVLLKGPALETSSLFCPTPDLVPHRLLHPVQSFPPAHLPRHLHLHRGLIERDYDDYCEDYRHHENTTLILESSPLTTPSSPGGYTVIRWKQRQPTSRQQLRCDLQNPPSFPYRGAVARDGL